MIILSCSQGRNSKCKQRLSLNSPYLPQDKPRKAIRLYKSLPCSFINRGRPTHLTSGEEIGSRQHTQTNFVITPPIYSSKSPFIFPKNPLFSPKRPTSPCLFPTEVVFKPEFYLYFLELLIVTPCTSPIIHEVIHVKKLLFFSCQSFITGDLSKVENSER